MWNPLSCEELLREETYPSGTRQRWHERWRQRRLQRRRQRRLQRRKRGRLETNTWGWGRLRRRQRIRLRVVHDSPTTTLVTDHAVRGTIVGHVDAHRRRFLGYSGQEGIGGGISRVFDKIRRARRSGVLKVACVTNGKVLRTYKKRASRVGQLERKLHF